MSAKLLLTCLVIFVVTANCFGGVNDSTNTLDQVNNEVTIQMLTQNDFTVDQSPTIVNISPTMTLTRNEGVSYGETLTGISLADLVRRKTETRCTNFVLSRFPRDGLRAMVDRTSVVTHPAVTTLRMREGPTNHLPFNQKVYTTYLATAGLVPRSTNVPDQTDVGWSTTRRGDIINTGSMPGVTWSTA